MPEGYSKDYFLRKIYMSFVSFTICSIYLAQCNGQKIRLAESEDRAVLRQSIAQFGPPRPLNYNNYNLPGPEIRINLLDFAVVNDIDDDSGNYTLKLRRLKRYISYNDRYETGETRMIDGKQMFVVKGHFSETFRRENGGYYIRTVGYINDENGYRLFFIDLSKIITRKSVKRPTLHVRGDIDTLRAKLYGAFNDGGLG